jgi:hypothetical protein
MDSFNGNFLTSRMTIGFTRTQLYLVVAGKMEVVRNTKAKFSRKLNTRREIEKTNEWK